MFNNSASKNSTTSNNRPPSGFSASKPPVSAQKDSMRDTKSPIKPGATPEKNTAQKSSQPSANKTKPPPKEHTAAPPMVIKGPVFNKDSIPKNTDPTLGGEQFCPPAFQAPNSYFNFYCKNTPASTNSMKVIPWDHNKKDYVYSAIKEEDLHGTISRRELKRRVDIFKESSYWDPVSIYNLSIVVFAVLFILVLIGILIYIIMNWESAKTYWYVLLTIPIVLLIIGFIVVMALKNRANKQTFARKAALDQELALISKGSPYKIRSGEASSYLEVFQDASGLPPPQATELVKVSIASMNTKSSQKPQLNLMEGDDQNDVSTTKLNGKEVSVEKSPPPSENKGIVTQLPPLSPMSQKKLAFRQRLESKKQGGTPVRPSVGAQSNSYQSVKPEQETVVQPGRSMNLMLDDSALN